MRTRLYLVTPPRIDDPAAFAGTLAHALGGGDAACLQIRLKPAEDAHVLAVARAALPVAHAKGLAVLINDRPDLAAQAGADGVHVGQEDTPYSAARAAVGASGIVGVTCHASRHLAMEAAERGADYVAFGAFYDTATKTPPARATPDILTWWQEMMEVPCVAIGGVTTDNAEPLVRAGADFLAVSAGVWAHPAGPRAAVAAFNALFDRLAQ